MKLSEFLQAVLPDEGKLVIARLADGERNGKAFKYFKHVVCEDQGQAKAAIAKLAGAKVDTYYALASYKQGFHKNDKDKTVVRTRDNVHKLKALWLDIDFKGGLSGPTEVVAALREFCKATRMPAPSILVHSGNGIHVYWPLQTAISKDRWLPLAEGLKRLAIDRGLQADHAVTADAARVLRPIGTGNYKDPALPKPVVPKFASDILHDPAVLADILGASASPHSASGTSPLFGGGGMDTVPLHLRSLGGPSLGELTGGLGSRTEVKSFIPNIAKKCGVLAHILSTGGEDCSEPEWTATLQLAKHCADGEFYYHALSEGHPEYDAADTTEKWQQRLENDAGPTLCDTYASFRPEICKACKFRNTIKTPLSLGEDEVVAVSEEKFPLNTWRPSEGNIGMERKMFDPGSKEYFWERVLHRTWYLDDASRDSENGLYTLKLRAKLGTADTIRIDIPSRLLGDATKLKQELADHGAPLRQEELRHWIELMSTWLQELQKKRQVGRSVTRMGWLETRDEDDTTKTKITGFTSGTSTYYPHGDPDVNLRISDQYKEIARHYIPTGSLENWTDAAHFLCQQDNPAFTAILASAFATPLFGFTGMPGAVLTVVSRESGLGKSSAMRTAQAVWGHPIKSMSSTSDTYLSIIRKTAFLKNLPVYWDEIRGEQALDNFYKTAFDIAQGKERTRLNSNAQMQEINDWQTMCIGASNESIFDYMATVGGQSDAASARVFEVEVDPFDDPTRAKRSALFDSLGRGYGMAGAVYSAYLARNQESLAQAVRAANEHLYSQWGFSQGERFWCGVIASLLVGAGAAASCGLCDIKTDTLKTYLRDRVTKLRARSGAIMAGSSARELVIAYIQAHQDGQIIVDRLPKQGDRSEPIIHSVPKAKLTILRCGDTYRFTKHDFAKWLKTSHRINYTSIQPEMNAKLGSTEIVTKLASNTRYEIPKARVIEVNL